MENKPELHIDKSGTKKWLLPDGRFHREGKPAIIYENGDESWYYNGNIHREDGPAITWNDVDHKSWFLDGVQYTEKGYKKEMRVRKIKRIKEII